MSIVWHSTGSSNLRKIYESGYLQKGSYVTKNSIKDMTPYQREEALCLDSDKGECMCECNIESFKLNEPLEGDLTCKGYSQYQLTENLHRDNCSCNCEGNRWSSVGLVLVGGILWLLKNQKVK
ncbi:MAG: hypothetical protein QME07_00310 [bacterium]|nr:hypothetical protein [bacterium]